MPSQDERQWIWTWTWTASDCPAGWFPAREYARVVRDPAALPGEATGVGVTIRPAVVAELRGTDGGNGMNDYGTTARRRMARKAHLCVTCDGGRIAPGEVYIEVTVFPGHDIVTVKRPTRYPECAPCAKRYGRDHMLDPVPIVQLYSQGLA